MESLEPKTELECLGKLAEECGEVCQAIGKILRHGWTPEWNNIKYDNRRDLLKEMEDVEKAIQYMRDKIKEQG